MSVKVNRLGLQLFAIYCLAYLGFIGLNACLPQFMSRMAFGGVNLAIAYGFALIAGACVLALLYAVIRQQDGGDDPAGPGGG